MAYRAIRLRPSLKDAYYSAGGIYSYLNSTPILRNTIIASSLVGVGFRKFFGGSPILECSNMYGNAGGDWIAGVAGQAGLNGNFSSDPLFCDAPNGDFTLHANSPCAPGNHPDGAACGLIGALDVVCGATTAVEPTSWGAVKAMFR